MIDGINLLPEEMRIVEKGRFYLTVFLMSLIFFSLFYFLHAGQQMKMEKVDSRLALLKNEMVLIKAQSDQARKILDKISQLEAKQRELSDRAALSAPIKERRIVWSEVIHDLSRMIPSQVWLSKISSFDVASDLKGMRVNGMALSSSAISDFIEAMEQSSSFEGTGMTYAHNVQYDSQDAFAFDLTSHIVQAVK